MISVGDRRQTIVAIGSSAAPAVRGVVRLSGEDAVAVLQRMLADGPNSTTTGDQLAGLRRATRLPLTIRLHEPLPTLRVIAMVWPTPRSYTGQPSIEIHTFGSAPLLEAIVQAACRQGARPAGPGEFTMRAFLAGRMDLAQAEAVLGVIDATSRGQLDAALNQLAGNVFRPLKQLREQLLNLLADIEAGLDFVDEDISFIDDASIARQLGEALQPLRQTQEQLTWRHRSRHAADIVLRGAPNAGKSSLLNALLGRQAALVSDQAGTTRDVIYAEATLAGRPLRLVDTAGIETQPDSISQQSQLAANEAHQAASLVVWCVDQRQLSGDRATDQAVLESLGADAPDAPDDTPAAENTTAGGGKRAGTTGAISTLLVATQADRRRDPSAMAGPPASGGPSAMAAESAQQAADRLQRLAAQGWLVTSAVSGQGLDELRRRLMEQLDGAPTAAESGISATAVRCIDSVQRAIESLESAQRMAACGQGHEWIADEIRLALSAVAEVTGEIYTDDILDRVFSRFCIGK